MLAKSFAKHSVFKNRLFFQTRTRTLGSICISDLTQIEQLKSALNDFSISTIINFAALTSVEECECNIPNAFRTNVRLLQTLAAWISNDRPDIHLINISTDHIYDAPSSEMSSECDVNPKNVYALTKLMGEYALSEICACNLRTNFFGKSYVKKLSFSDWIVEKNRRSEVIHAFDDVFFSPVATVTLTGVIDSIIGARLQGTFNLGSVESITKADFVSRLINALGLDQQLVQPTSIDSRNDLVARPKNMAMDSSKLFRALSLKPRLIDDEIGLYIEELLS